jgi:hypothetical protein
MPAASDNGFSAVVARTSTAHTQRRLDEGDGENPRRDANRREIARLKWRLANVVKRELSPGAGLRFALAFRL